MVRRSVYMVAGVSMTPAQLKALQEYTQAVCAHMLFYATDPVNQQLRYKAARDSLEAAFGTKLPPPDLLVPQPKSALPDLL